MSRSTQVLALGLGLALASPALRAQGPTFKAMPFAAGTQANAVALGQFDGDPSGFLDLVIADGADFVRVFSGDGDGTFSFQFQVPTQGSAISVALAHVNNDAHLDLVAGTSAGRLHTWLGNGLGNFSAASTVYSTITGTPPDPIDLVVADVTGDGRTDIVAANFFANSISILAGNGSGNFGTPLVYTFPGLLLRTVDAADFDGDGDLDLVTGGLGVPMRVMRNDGGTFVEQLPHTGVAGFQVRTGDFDGNGTLDFGIAGGVSDSLVVIPGAGDGSFGAPVEYPAGFEPLALATGHFDTDGDLDVALPTSVSSRVAVLLGDGAGGFTHDSTHPNAGDELSVAVGDVDGDGLDDIVTANPTNGTVTVLLNLGTGQFADEGGALPQFDGVVAQLTGLGPLSAGSSNRLELAFARSTTLSNVVLGYSLLAAPFKGGTLVPFPSKILFNLPVDTMGNASLPFVWPAGVPAGSEAWAQHWFSDAGNPSGLASSNGVRFIAD